MSDQVTNLFSPESAAPTAGPLIPSKTLAWVGIKVRGIKATKTTGGKYADIELTVADGPYKNRKIWVMICDPYDQLNSEEWRKMAVSAMTRIFESAQVFVVGNPGSYEIFRGKSFQDIAAAMDGKVAACEIKIAADKTGSYPDKNDIAEWLSPNPVSSSVKKFTALIHPEQASDAARGEFLKVPAGAPVAPAWAAGAPTPAAPAATLAATPEADPAVASQPAQPVATAPVAAGWTPPAPVATTAPAGPAPAAPGAKPAWMQ